MNTFKINEIVFDAENKEYVKISNGIPVEENDALGINEREVTPTEAIALRVVGINKGVPSIAYTYRKVNPEKLSKTSHQPTYFDTIMAYGNPKRFVFVGRV